MPVFAPDKTQTVEQAKQNCAFVSSADYEKIYAETKTTPVYLQINGIVILTKELKDVPAGKIFVNGNTRKHARISLLNAVDAAVYTPEPKDYCDRACFNLIPRKALPFKEIDTDELVRETRPQFMNRPLYKDQPLTIEFKGQTFDCVPKKLSPEDNIAIVCQTTEMRFFVPHPASKDLELTGSCVEDMSPVKDS